MLSVSQGLGELERIKSKKEADLLFKDGDSIFSFPYKLVFTIRNTESEVPTVKILVSVPKRKFKNAVDRNLIRRRIKEAYRKNKNELDFPSIGKELLLSFVYTYHEIRDFNELQKRLILSLHKLNLQLKSLK